MILSISASRSGGVGSLIQCVDATRNGDDVVEKAAETTSKVRLGQRTTSGNNSSNGRIRRPQTKTLRHAWVTPVSTNRRCAPDDRFALGKKPCAMEQRIDELYGFRPPSFDFVFTALGASTALRTAYIAAIDDHTPSIETTLK